MAITASDARRNLVRLIERVNLDRTEIEIVSKRGCAVLMSKDEFDALVETSYLLRSPATLTASCRRWDPHVGPKSSHTSSSFKLLSASGRTLGAPRQIEAPHSAGFRGTRGTQNPTRITTRIDRFATSQGYRRGMSRDQKIQPAAAKTAS